MAANKTIGGINVTITATIDKFAKNIAGAQRMLGGFRKSIGGLVFSLKGLGAALAIGGTTKLIADQYKAIDAMEELSQKTGINTEKLAGLQLAAQNAGVSNELLEKSLVKVGNAYGMNGDDALRQWIEKTSRLTTQHEKLAAATEMFGSRGADMVRFLTGGVKALDDANKAADKMGWAVSQANAVAIGGIMEKWDHLKDHVTGVFRTIASESWPYINALMDGTQNFIDNMGGGKGVGTFITDVLVHMAKDVVDGINSMVGHVIKAVGDFMMFIKEWRTTSPAKTLGLGFKSDTDRGSAFLSAAKMRSTGLGYINNPPSKAIQKFVDDARAAAAAAVLPTGPGLFESLMGSASKWGGNTLLTGQQAAGGIGNMLMGQLQAASMRAGSMDFAKMTVGQRPSLAFAESGSVESYRQQAAIRRQGEQIDKQQLSVLKDIREAVRQPVTIPTSPINLWKG